MEILELIKKRFSARSYKSDAVEQEKLNKIVECARQDYHWQQCANCS